MLLLSLSYWELEEKISANWSQLSTNAAKKKKMENNRAQVVYLIAVVLSQMFLKIFWPLNLTTPDEPQHRPALLELDHTVEILKLKNITELKRPSVVFWSWLRNYAFPSYSLQKTASNGSMFHSRARLHGCGFPISELETNSTQLINVPRRSSNLLLNLTKTKPLWRQLTTHSQISFSIIQSAAASSSHLQRHSPFKQLGAHTHTLQDDTTPNTHKHTRD